ncbi:Gfo/Idh/MocA family oxidoreductase [Microbacterium sp. TPD7012]|uniref:Gfo/Idh/MocA family protein n=1 Tax=Microbacterium sp. TPD7012 TaxID=2171975 RepID=UPI000D519A4A|nr:Gfo/Idh/MocA family oxidoreductase [Microbacterium sp. TPD7012]PVE96852.1 oxidoreductase [Microbacterium sp. TPD7012]
MRSLPTTTVTPLRGGPVARWGVLGPGGIAEDWVSALHRHTDQRVLAVASRSADRSRAFAVRHGIPRPYEGHEALLQDPDVDVVYIAAPHAQHHPLALAAIAAGKHVLIEKPLALDAAQAAEIADAARSAGVFAMEAMWSRYLPQSQLIARLLAEGELGDVRLVTAHLGWRWRYDPADRNFDPAVGGGVMLDAGVYSLWFAHSVLGAATSVVARGTLAPTGVETEAVVLLENAEGVHAALSASSTVTTPGLAAIHGSSGSVHFDTSFVFPAALRIARGGDERRWRDESGLVGRDGLAWQATAVATYLAEGRMQSPLHSLDDSVAVMRALDEVRRQIGSR